MDLRLEPPPPLPAPELVPGSMVLTDSNMNFIWSGSAHSKSVFMTSTNLGSEADWEPVTTNMFGADALATNSYVIDAEVQRFLDFLSFWLLCFLFFLFKA